MAPVLQLELEQFVCRVLWGRIWILDRSSHLLNQVSSDLLRYHPVVALDGRLREIVCVQTHQATPSSETVTAHCPAARLDAISRKHRTQTLQATARAVQLSQRPEIALLNSLPALPIQLVHVFARIMQRKCRGKQRQNANLHGSAIGSQSFLRRTSYICTHG
jgi:hypothetical protein